MLTGTRQRLYAIANYNSSDFNLTKRQLDAIDTETELLDLSVATRGGRILLNHLSFVMEGEEENVTVSISNGQGRIISSDGDDVDIELKRLNAKITFDVVANVTEAIDGTLKFVPKSYMVMNVPLNASIINKETNLSDAQYASMDEETLSQAIYPVGFYRNKARQIIELSKELVEKYDSKVPSEIDELVKFNGVGRKTANLTLAKGFQIPAICVDVHVHRISNRLGYVSTKTPDETEMELRKKLPKKYWLDINTILVTHGQNICKPQRPLCERCCISKYCKTFNSSKT